MMKNKAWLIGALAVAVVTGGMIGASTMSVGQAKENDQSPAVTTLQTTSHVQAKDRSAHKQQAILTVDEVIAIAQQHADGRVDGVELEREKGQRYYEIEIENRDMEFEIEIDAYTGEILKLEKEPVSKPESPQKASAPSKGNTKQDRQKMISMSEAIAIALAKAPGKVDEAELDRDDGLVYYEIEIETDRGEVEIEVDAYTGQILSIEYDD